MKSCYGHLSRKQKITYLVILGKQYKRPLGESEIACDDKLHTGPYILHETLHLVLICTTLTIALPLRLGLTKTNSMELNRS
jgi:hypothetical protein